MTRLWILGIFAIAFAGAYGQTPEITLLEPSLDHLFPAPCQREVNVLGEVSSPAVIREIGVALLAPDSTSTACPCSVYYQQGNTKAVFKARARIAPPHSIIAVTVTLDNGEKHQREFPLRTACTNSEYKSFDLLIEKKVHDSTVRCLEFSRDGRYLISCGDDKTIKVVRPGNLQVLRVFKGHQGIVRQARITPDNRYIVSCSDDKTVKLWEFNSGKLLHTFQGHEDPVHTVAISPDGKCIASGSYRFRIFDLETKKQLMVSNVQYGASCALLYTPDGRYLVSGDQNENIIIWDVEKNEARYEREDAHTGDVISLALHPSGRYLYSGCKEGYIKWWQVLLNPSDSCWDGEDNALWEIRLTLVKDNEKDPAEIPTSVLDANPDDYTTIRKYPVYELTKDPAAIKSTELIKKSKRPYSKFDVEGEIVALSLNGTGEFLLLATGKGEVRIHETFTALSRCSFLIKHLLQCGTFSWDGSMVAIGGVEGEIWVYGPK